MQFLDPARRVLGPVGGQIQDQPVGGLYKHQFRDVARLPGQHPDGRPDSGHLREFQEGFETGQARNTQMDRQGVSPTLDLPVPGDDRLRVEAELGFDIQLKPGLLGEPVLPQQRLLQRRLRDIRGALGVPGHSQLGDAVLLEQTGLHQIHGGCERTGRPVETAGNHQRLGHARLILQTAEKTVQHGPVCDRAGGDMRHRLEPFAAEPCSNRDRVRWVVARQEGHVDRGAVGQMVCETRDLRRGGGGGLD